MITTLNISKRNGHLDGFTRNICVIGRHRISGNQIEGNDSNWLYQWPHDCCTWSDVSSWNRRIIMCEIVNGVRSLKWELQDPKSTFRDHVLSLYLTIFPRRYNATHSQLNINNELKIKTALWPDLSHEDTGPIQLCPVGWGCRGVRPTPQQRVSGIWHQTIWWWGSSIAGALGMRSIPSSPSLPVPL